MRTVTELKQLELLPTKEYIWEAYSRLIQLNRLLPLFEGRHVLLIEESSYSDSTYYQLIYRTLQEFGWWGRLFFRKKSKLGPPIVLAEIIEGPGHMILIIRSDSLEYSLREVFCRFEELQVALKSSVDRFL